MYSAHQRAFKYLHRFWKARQHTVERSRSLRRTQVFENLFSLSVWQPCEITTEPLQEEDGGRSRALKSLRCRNPARRISLSANRTEGWGGRKKLKDSQTKALKPNRPHKNIYISHSIFFWLVSLQSYLCQNNSPLHPECYVTGDMLEQSCWRRKGRKKRETKYSLTPLSFFVVV